ncbi:MAG: SRPBCC family protein [Thermoleophilaceae bacterium]
MSKWTARASVAGHPDEVLDLLTEPAAIRSWAPIPFEVTALDGDRLEAGSVARVSGGLAGRKVSFEVEVIEAGEGRLSLIASGPITLDVEYDVRPGAAGSQVEASVAVSGASGLGGRLLGTANGRPTRRGRAQQRGRPDRAAVRARPGRLSRPATFTQSCQGW